MRRWYCGWNSLPTDAKEKEKMSEPSKEALAAANKMEAAFHCDGRDTKRFAAIIQQAIDAATAKLRAELAEAYMTLAELRRLWPQVHRAIRSDIQLGEAAEEIYKMSEILSPEEPT